MIRKSTAQHRIDDLEEGYILETERLSLLHQVESRIRARSEAKKHISNPPDSEGNLEGQIAQLLVAKEPDEKERGKNIASKIRNVRNLIEVASSEEVRDHRGK